MSDGRIEIVDLPGEVPPPSAALRARVDADGAVSLRRPLVDWAMQLGLWTVVAAAAVLVFGMRADHAALHAAALGWVLLVGGALACLLVPERGQVLASAVRMRGVLVVLPVAAAALAFGVLDGTTTSLHPANDEARALAHCLAFGLLVSIPALALGWIALRRLVPVTGALGGAALGATAGTLAAFVLHLACSTGGALHAGLGHAGGLVLGAVIGALLGRAR